MHLVLFWGNFDELNCGTLLCYDWMVQRNGDQYRYGGDHIGLVNPSRLNLSSFQCCWSVCSLMKLYSWVNDQMTTKRIDAERTEKHCIYIHVVSSTDFQRFQISRTLHLNSKSPNQALCFDSGLLIVTRSNYRRQ
jgi:hypothetical protein